MIIFAVMQILRLLIELATLVVKIMEISGH